ncbi:MAG TPA: PilZ domain-containing protein [Myxococcales bacterium]|nr:PilZ domain-containing protein [Myxococcales bacterium]
MVDIDRESFAEIMDLSRKALGPGLAAPERERWRALTSQVLELLSNISPSGSERRRYLRAAAGLTVEVLAPAKIGGLVTSSVSGGGLSMQMADPPDVGTALTLSIVVSQRPQPIPASASVVWRRPPPSGEVGAVFTEIDERDRDLLEATVIERLSATNFAGY